MPDEACGEKSRSYGRFPTWAAALPGIIGQSLAVVAAIAHHVDDQGEPIRA
jgi:hypothetical protein